MVAVVLVLVVVTVLVVMTMMATVAVTVAVIIVTSGNKVVRGRGSLVGTRALPRLLHYRVVQSILG